MREGVRVEQVAGLAQALDDQRVRVPDGDTLQPCRSRLVEAAVGLDGAQYLETLAQTGRVVVCAMPWRRVDQPRAFVQRYVVCGNEPSAAPVREQWMGVLDPGFREIPPARDSELFDPPGAACLEHALAERLCKDDMTMCCGPGGFEAVQRIAGPG